MLFSRVWTLLLVDNVARDNLPKFACKSYLFCPITFWNSSHLIHKLSKSLQNCDGDLSFCFSRIFAMNKYQSYIECGMIKYKLICQFSIKLIYYRTSFFVLAPSSFLLLEYVRSNLFDAFSVFFFHTTFKHDRKFTSLKIGFNYSVFLGNKLFPSALVVFEKLSKGSF